MARLSLISDHVGTNPIIISEMHAHHSYLTMWEHLPRPCQKGPALTSVNQCQKGSAPTLIHARNQSSMLKGSTLTSENQCQKGSALIFNHAKNQSSMLKGICTYIWQLMSESLCTHIWSCRNQSYSHIRMALSPRLSFSGNWPGASIPRMAFNA